MFNFCKSATEQSTAFHGQPAGVVLTRNFRALWQKGLCFFPSPKNRFTFEFNRRGASRMHRHSSIGYVFQLELLKRHHSDPVGLFY